MTDEERDALREAFDLASAEFRAYLPAANNRIDTLEGLTFSVEHDRLYKASMAAYEALEATWPKRLRLTHPATSNKEKA